VFGPPVNLKRTKASEYAPSPQAKKCFRASDNDRNSPLPEGFCLPQQSRPTTPCPTSPPCSLPRSLSPSCSLSPPHSLSFQSGSSTNLDEDNISIDYEIPTVVTDSHRNAGSGKLKNSKLTSIWSIESAPEREVRVQREFAALRNDAETRAMNAAHSQRLKLLRKRADDRERQQKHREIVRAKKIAEGWVPGKKRVRLTVCKYLISFLLQKAGVFLASHETSGETTLSVAEASRPRRD